MSYNFHIGQDVVCIKSHTKAVVLKDKIYQVKSLRKPCCKVQVDVGIKSEDKTGSGLFTTSCRLCGTKTHNGTDNTFWISCRLFAPLDELTDISELQEVL